MKRWAPWQQLGFRAKLIWGGVLLQLLTLAAVTLGASTLVDRYLQGELQARVAQLKPLFNAALSVPMAQRDYATVAAILGETRITRDIEFICVRDVQGRVIAEDRASGSAIALGSSDAKPSRDPARPATFDFSAPLEIGGQTLGRVEFGLSRDALAQTRQQLLWAIAGISVLAMALFSALLAALSHAVTRPLMDLVVAARDIHAANYDVEFDPHRKDELGVLMKAFARLGQEVRRKVTELTQSEVLQRRYLEEAVRRQTETSLALQAAESANEAKADFIANMSHEIRTPMNAIVGYADMLLRTPLNGDQQEYASRLQIASTTLLGVINNVLDFSKIEAGQLQASREPFDIVATVDNVAALFQPQLRDKAVRLHLDIDPGVPRIVSGDALRLHQVLVNLVGNAVKFTEEGQVRIRVQDVGTDAARPTLRIAVCDTGIGIAPEQIERIFSPFAQADGSITRRFGGTGLGLSISRRLVALMGGTLALRSEPGQGSEFWVEIPFEAVDEARASDWLGLSPVTDGSRRPWATGPAAATADADSAPPPSGTAGQAAAGSAPPDAGPPAGVGSLDRAALEPLLDELDDLLSRNMMGARRLADRVRRQVQGTGWSEPFSGIEQEVRRLRFREARSRLAALRAGGDEASSDVTRATRS